jgi:GxxExxY protein
VLDSTDSHPHGPRRRPKVTKIKSIERLAPIHTCQMVTYLQITGLHVGLIMNFNNPVLKDGIKRVLV